LVEFGDQLKPGCIRDSNRPMLKSAIRESEYRWFQNIIDLGIAKDNKEDIGEKISRALNEADVLISTGKCSELFGPFLTICDY
jgi:molybdopterin biosynthesis enzyme